MPASLGSVNGDDTAKRGPEGGGWAEDNGEGLGIEPAAKKRGTKKTRLVSEMETQPPDARVTP